MTYYTSNDVFINFSDFYDSCHTGVLVSYDTRHGLPQCAAVYTSTRGTTEHLHCRHFLCTADQKCFHSCLLRRRAQPVIDWGDIRLTGSIQRNGKTWPLVCLSVNTNLTMANLEIFVSSTMSILGKSAVFFWYLRF